MTTASAMRLNTLKRICTDLADRFGPWLSDGSWRERAFCRGREVDRYFPEGADYGSAVVKDIAARDCVRCPVRIQCLTDALATRGTSGIHGGILFPGALVKFDANTFERELIWDTYRSNLAATVRLEHRRGLLGC